MNTRTPSSYICTWCESSYCHASGKSRHEKTCSKKPHSKQKLSITKKPTSVEAITNIVEDLLKKRKPDYTFNINNYIIISATTFEDIVKQFGRDQALHLLSTGNVVDITKKLYFDGKIPDQYPVACRESHHYRFLNESREIVDDHGGTQINKLIINTMRDAMISATNATIKDQLDGKPIYNDIGTMQNQLISLSSHDIQPELSKLAHNPHHPFFQPSDKPDQ